MKYAVCCVLSVQWQDTHNTDQEKQYAVGVTHEPGLNVFSKWDEY